MDIARLRAETPGSAHVLHFNNAGAALTPDPVHAAMVGHLELERRIGGYEAARAAAPALADFYAAFATLLNCDPDEVAFVENATRGWDMAFYALPLRPGDRIITHSTEYASNYLAYLQLVRRKGVVIDVAPSDGAGDIDLAALESMIRPQTRLIAITHVPSQSGGIAPAAALGAIAARHGLWYLLDACQSAGQIALDVRAIGCHMLSGTGRKFLRGPRGTGFLYVARALAETLEPPFLDLHAARWTGPDGYTLAPGATRFENWESAVAGKIGLATAARHALALGLPAIEARVRALAATLRCALADRGLAVHDRGTALSGIVTLTGPEPPEAMQPRLAALGINTSVSPASYARLDLGPRGLPSVLRASVHYYNTEDEIARFVAAL